MASSSTRRPRARYEKIYLAARQSGRIAVKQLVVELDGTASLAFLVYLHKSVSRSAGRSGTDDNLSGGLDLSCK